LGIGLFLFFYHPQKLLEVDFLNVGQGDSELIKTPYGQNVLIDGGPDNKVLAELGRNLPFCRGALIWSLIRIRTMIMYPG